MKVKLSYEIPSSKDGVVDAREFEFDTKNTAEAVVGLPKGSSSPPPAAAPGSVAYSGRHDQGLLGPLKEGGEMSRMIQCVQNAKKTSDAFLTEVIENEKSDVTGVKRPRSD